MGYYHQIFGQEYPVASKIPSDSFVIGSALVSVPTGNGAQIPGVIQSDDEKSRPYSVYSRNLELRQIFDKQQYDNDTVGQVHRVPQRVSFHAPASCRYTVFLFSFAGLFLPIKMKKQTSGNTIQKGNTEEKNAFVFATSKTNQQPAKQ